MQEDLSTSNGVDDRKEKPPLLLSELFNLRIVVFLVVQLIIALTLYIFISDPLSFICFAFVSFIFSVTFPWAENMAPRLFGCLARDPVDVVYYSLAILGVVLFFLSERIDEHSDRINNSISSGENRIDFLTVLSKVGGDFQNRVENTQEIEFLMSEYVQELIHFYTENTKSSDWCKLLEADQKKILRV